MNTRILKELKLSLLLTDNREICYKIALAYFLGDTTIEQTQVSGFLVKKYYYRTIFGKYLYKTRFFRR